MMTRRQHRLFRYVLVMGLMAVAFAYWGYSRVRPSRDTVESLVESAQPQSALDVQVILATENLSGKFIFLEQRSQPDYRLLQFDPSTKSLTTVFDIPRGGLVYQIGLASDNDQLLMTYTPPSAGNTTNPDHNGIYTLNLTIEDDQPTLILDAPQSDTYYAYPQWGMDGESIYYVVYSTIGDNKHRRRIEQFFPATGDIEVIVENATLPSLHTNGRQLTYIYIDSETEKRSLRTINLVDNVDEELVSSDAYPDLDTPLLYEDILYFAVLKEAPQGNLRGNGVVNAHGNHNQPADWYMLTDDTNIPQQVTNEEFVLLFGASSPDGKYLSSVTSLGVYITDLASGETSQILKSRAIRSLVWIAD